MIHARKKALLQSASGPTELVGRKTNEINDLQVRDPHAKFGELTVANDFVVWKDQAVDSQVRRKMVEPAKANLSVGKHVKLPSISRSSFY